MAKLKNYSRSYFGKDLTNDQFNALKAIDAFYQDKDKFSFCLKGAAGTGKTFLINRFFQHINNRPAVITAPTHKAVRVIERMVHRKGQTIQSLHGLRPNFNISSFDIDNLTFDTLGEAKIRNYYIVINDECSMVSDSLLELNNIRSKQFNTKILYVGDPYQLPPVEGQRYSSTFDIENQFTLKEIVRQKEGNPIRELLPILEDDVDNQTSGFINHVLTNPGKIINGVGWQSFDKLKFIDKVIEAFNSKELENNINHCRMLSWTNLSVLMWNKFIRQKVITGYENHLITENDIITSYNTIVDEFFSPIIINSDDYFVMDVYERESEHGFKVYLSVLKSVEDNKISKVQIVDHTDKNWIKYYEVLNELHFNAKYAAARDRKKMFRQYYDFKNQFLTFINFPLVDNIQDMFAFAKNMMKNTNMVWTETLQFYKNLDNVRAWVQKDLDYGFALTVHKSQGSTYDISFLNLLDIAYYKGNRRMPFSNTANRPFAKELRNKLLYTGLTRASEKAIILI